ncbi:MAG: hypothetical protein DRQ51_09325 [Gammaproteobacteria bacterium]|nr:MAG: hypothetical protein DRQ51_09325 [Gammaproteobacteria bacterium]
MQTLSVNIKENFVDEFLKFVNNNNNKITIEQDKNLKLDPYFHQRQKHLKKIRQQIDDGTMPMLNENEFNQELDKFIKNLNAN